MTEQAFASSGPEPFWTSHVSHAEAVRAYQERLPQWRSQQQFSPVQASIPHPTRTVSTQQAGLLKPGSLKTPGVPAARSADQPVTPTAAAGSTGAVTERVVASVRTSPMPVVRRYHGQNGDSTFTVEVLLAEHVDGFYEPHESWSSDDHAVMAGALGPFPKQKGVNRPSLDDKPPAEGRVVSVHLSAVGSEPAGLVLMRERPSWGPEANGSLEISKLYVRPSMRSLGVATALMRSMLDEAKRDPLRRPVRLACVGDDTSVNSPDLLDSREAAEEVFETVGFTFDDPSNHHLPHRMRRMTWVPPTPTYTKRS